MSHHQREPGSIINVSAWEYDQGSEEYGNYATAHLDGDAVAGIGPAQGPDGPPAAWTAYLAVDDAASS